MRTKKEPDYRIDLTKCRICGRLSARAYQNSVHLCEECEENMPMDGYAYDLLK